MIEIEMGGPILGGVVPVGGFSMRFVQLEDGVFAPVVSVDNGGEDNLAPNGADERLVVGVGVGQLGELQGDTTHVKWSLEDANVRVRFVGDPTAVIGHLLVAGDEGVWSRALAQSARFVRAAGADGVLFVTELVAGT